jgi:hypothetical protein
MKLKILLFGQLKEKLNADFIEIEVICSDVKEHQNRVETRIADIKGHILPTWQEIEGLQYEEWGLQGIRIDTAIYTPDQNIERILDFLSRDKD